MSLFTPPNVGQPEEQQQVQFQPLWDEASLRELIKSYKKNPEFTDDTTKELIKQHSAYYNVPFYEGEFDLISAFSHAGAGFFEGFTTLNLMEPADNEYEQIFRNLGHLAGFAPGLLATPLRGLSKLAPQMASLKSLTKTAAMLNDKSVPMAGAKFLTRKTKEIVRPMMGKVTTGRANATSTALDFLTGSKARHIAEGAFHLGAASAISSWQGGVDEMMSGFLHGAMAGGVFRSIGQLRLADTKSGNKIARGIAGSLFMGLPSTVRGATTPEQVYDYTMGAYFGKGERPAHKMRGQKFLNKVIKDAQSDPKLRTSYDPELHPDFETLDPMEKDYVLRKHKTVTGPLEALRAMNKALVEEGMDPKFLKTIPVEIEGFEPVEVEGEEGTGQEIQYKIKRKILDQYKSIIYSGGAAGADTIWATAGKERGIQTVNYTFEGHEHIAAKAPGIPQVLSEADLMKANPAVAKAARYLDKNAPNPGYVLNLIRRNWFQVKNAQAVYAVGKIEDGTKGRGALNPELKNKAVRGGTGWTVAMAIQGKKPVHVYDSSTKKWWTFNHKSGYFQPIKGLPPKPPRNWAAIGSSKEDYTPKDAEQQIYKFMSHYYPKGVKRKLTKKEIIAEAEAKKKRKKVLKPYIDTLMEDITANTEELKIAKIDLKNAKDAGDTKQQALLKTHIKSLESAIESDTVERENYIAKEEHPMVDTATGEIIMPPKEDKVDTESGGPGQGVVKSGTALEFVNDNMVGIWGTGGTPRERLELQRDLANQLLAKIKEVSLTREDITENRSEEVIQWIKEMYNAHNVGKKEQLEFGLSVEQKGKVRQFISRENLEAQISFLMTNEDGIIGKVTQKDYVPNTQAGIAKRQREPVKILEALYTKITGKVTSLATVDNVTITDEYGKRKDLTLIRYRDKFFNHYRYEKNMTEKRAEIAADNAFNAWKSKIMYQAFKNHNMYYYGGRGDAERMFFMKFHPDVDAFLTKNKISSKTKTLLSKYKLTADMETQRDEFQKKFHSSLSSYNSRIVFDKAYMSNILYDAQLNGFEIGRKGANLKKVLDIMFDPKNDFISTSKAFNKRSQIWFTNGFASDAKFLSKRIKDLDKDNPQLNYIISQDLPADIRAKMKKNKLWSSDIKRLSTELEEGVDGAYLVRTDVLKGLNEDAGMPILETQNKSFIVSPHAEKGALLGKYMMHDAGSAMSKMMAKKGIHMIMMGSGVKQRGTRQEGDYDVTKKGLTFKKGTEIYQLDPKHIYHNYSVKQDEKMAQWQRAPKQLLGLLLDNAKSPFQKEVIDDMINSILQSRFEGNDIINQEFNEFLNKDVQAKTTFIDNLVNRKQLKSFISELSIPNLVKGLKEPHNHAFAEAAYRHLILREKTSLIEDFNKGEVNADEYQRAMQDIVLANTAYDAKILAARAAAGKDGNFFGVFFDKGVRNYREQVVRNFIVREATKPKMNNSLAARMRPYDKAMRQDLDGVNPLLKRLNKDDSIFFLDEYFRNTWIETGVENIGRVQLGKLWEGRNDVYKDVKVKDIIQSSVLRVPLDSMSGVQALKFAGFTGRQGHGILLHSRAMRAMGGADLDGDEAFVFFGGKKGFKKSWHNVFKANKDEFYFKKGKNEYVADNKGAEIPKAIRDHLGLGKKVLTYRDLLTTHQDYTDEQRRLTESRGSMYSPTERERIAHSAMHGRALLGQAAVTPKQIMALTHSIVANGPNQSDTYRISRKERNPKTKKMEWNEYDITIAARQNTKAIKWRDFARELGRAQVAFSSDPMDELGFKTKDEWFKALHASHFSIVSIKTPTGQKVPPSKLGYWNLEARDLKQGMYKKIKNMDSAFWGRDWSRNRKWSMPEIREMGAPAFELLPEQQSSFMVQVARRLSPLDWSDSALGRVDVKAVAKMYADLASAIRTEGPLRDILGRSTLKVLENIATKKTYKHELYNPDIIREIADKRLEFEKVIEYDGLKRKGELSVDQELLVKGQNYRTDAGHQARMKVLQEVARMGEDFFINDINDIASFQVIKTLYDKMSTQERARIGDIHEFIDKLKKKSYLMTVERNRVKTFDWARLSPFQQGVIKIILKNPKLRKMLPQAYTMQKGQPSAVADRGEIDLQIDKFRTSKKLTKNENKMLDYLTLGSLRRGDLEQINEIESKLTGKMRSDTGVKELLSHLRSNAAKTSLTRMGWESEMIDPESKTEMIKPLIDIITDTFTRPKEAEVKKIEKFADEVKEELVDEKGNDYNEDYLEGSLAKVTGFDGLKDGAEFSTVPKEMQAKARELITHLEGQNANFRKNFNEVVRSLIGKEINSLTLYDYDVLNNWFKDIKAGTIFQKIFTKKDLTKLSQRHHWLFPRTVNRELMRDDIQLMEERGMFALASGRAREGKLMRPTHFVEMARDWVARTNDSAAETSEQYVQGLQQDLLFTNAFEDGDVLRQIAVRGREKGYWEWKSFKDIMKPTDYINMKTYLKYHEDILKHHGDKLEKKYTIEYRGDRVEKTGAEIVEIINRRYTRFFEKMHKFITGNVDSDGINQTLEKYRIDWYDKKSQTGARIDYNAFIKDMEKDWRDGKAIVQDIGIDGLRTITRSMMVDLMKSYPEYRDVLMNNPVGTTGKIPPEFYWPHMHFNKKLAGDGVKKYIKHLKEEPWQSFDSKSEVKAEKIRANQLKSLLYKHKSLTGDWVFEEAEELNNFNDLLDSIGKGVKASQETVRWFNDLKKAGAMHSRKNHIPGWSIESSAVETYARSLVNTYHRQLAQIFARDIITKMGDKDTGMARYLDKKDVKSWQNFMQLYVQDALGSPSIIPEKWLEDPNMKLRGTPYAWWSDNNVKNKINKIMGQFGLKQSDLPEELRGVDVQQLRHWSNLEAQYEMASLLAHPKSMVTNIFGGTMHTVESAGWKNWRNSRNISWLKQNINPKWNSMQDVMNFVVGTGVLPEYMIYEMGLNKEMKQARNKQFLKDIAKKWSKDPALEESTMREIAKKHGVKERVVQFAAKFMSVPERHIRRDAFMAHYIQAWERWGGAVKNPEHPFLIEQAKKGVRATQFLYSAPFRPAFARTALGKVMTRFQLWSWNAVSFRNDVFRQAKIYGFTPGTEAYDRYARMMQMDIFVFALANMFAYSLFETALPAPWNWLQDTADWIFGNEKERDRAFFGQWPKQLAPLQMVTPPILRLLPSSMRAIVDDDWSKVGKYYIWTMAPFGRMARDVFGPGNLIENPIRVIEKTTGFPLLQLQSKGHKLKKEQEEGKRPPSPRPGLKIF